MATNSNYVLAPSLQEYFVDKTTGFPLNGGQIYFYSDNNRQSLQPKPVYELSGSPPNYSFTPLPNPLKLSNVGTVQNIDGADVIPYYYLLDDSGQPELYYIVVTDKFGNEQFTRQGWPGTFASSSGDAGSGNINYIPNGQFLCHTNFPENIAPAGESAIAQGGWYYVKPETSVSLDIVSFDTLQFTQDPPQSPRFDLSVSVVSPDSSDSFKNIQIRFNDVNKFSSTDQVYTFGFSAKSSVEIPIGIQIYKYFGDSEPPSQLTQYIEDITTSRNFYSFTISFGSNAGDIVDTESNNDYVAIQIALPTERAFTFNATDFVLLPGQVALSSFPIQTNADMISRSVAGWLDTPSPEGMDLYLPSILTKEGMTYDHSQVADLGMSVGPVESTDSFPPPRHNKMPANGQSYISHNYSSNGIPYKRLSNKLIEIALNAYGAAIPVYGTGINYFTAYKNSDGTFPERMRITYNSAGAGSPAAQDFNTGFSFTRLTTYNGSVSGIAPIGLSAYSTTTDGLINVFLKGTFLAGASNNGTPGNPISVNGNISNEDNGLLSFQQTKGFSVIMPPSASLANGPGQTADGIRFSSSTTNYIMYFVVNGENTPADGTRVPIIVSMPSGLTAKECANITREAFDAFQITEIDMSSGAPASGSYFTAYCNPSSLRTIDVWYNVNNEGGYTQNPLREAIEVKILSSFDSNQIKNATCDAINSYQFAAPLLDGQYFRCADPSGIYDTDTGTRFTNVTGFCGPLPGTNELQQFLRHTHVYNGLPDQADLGFVSGIRQIQPQTTSGSGGSETRTNNTTVYGYIRY